jgi:hypothetical protein
MNREDLWKKLLKNNPKLAANPHFTSEGVRKFFVTVWDHGYRHGREEEARPSGPRPLRNETYGIFDEIFGSLRKK